MKQLLSELFRWNKFSKWYKLIIVTLFVAYIVFWGMTIYLSKIQTQNSFSPILPVMPEDSLGYEKLVNSILSGNGFSKDGQIETLRTPGYPIFVAIFKSIGQSYFFVTLIQIFIVFISALIVRQIGIFFDSQRVGEIASIIFLLNPVTITLSLIILTDTVFLFLFILGFYLAINLDREKLKTQSLIVAIIFGMAIYIRLGLFGIPILVSPVLLSKLDWKSKLKAMSIIVVTLVAIVLPWFYRNYVNTGVFGFNSFRAVNYAWVMPKYLASQNGTSEEDELVKFEEKTGVSGELMIHNIKNSQKINSVAQHIILENPVSYLKYHVITAVPFVFPSTIAFARDVYMSALRLKGESIPGAINLLAEGDYRGFVGAVLKVWWKIAERLLWFLGYFAILITTWYRRKDLSTWVFIFIFGYLMFLSGPAGGPRLTFQAFPFIFILFVSSLIFIYEKFAPKK